MDIFICDDNTLICNEINSLVSEFFRTNNMTMPVFIHLPMGNLFYHLM